MHDACILVLECMMHTPAAAPPIENRIKKRYEHTFNGRSSSRSEQGYYGVGMLQGDPMRSDLGQTLGQVRLE